MFYMVSHRKKRQEFLESIYPMLSEKNKEFISYMMYGSFRRISILKNETDYSFIIEKVSPEGLSSKIIVNFDDLNCDLPSLLNKEAETILAQKEIMKISLKETGYTEGEVTKRLVLIRLLAAKVKDDIKQFNKIHK